MLTKSDKSWAEGKFATKDDLKGFATKEDLTASNVRLRNDMAKMEDRLKGEINSKHDEVMTVLDKIMGEVVKGREHDLVVAHQIEKLNKQVFA